MSRVALIGDNSVEYVKALLEIWKNGHSAVLPDWRIPPLSAIELMREADVRLCYIEESLLPNFNLPAARGISFQAFSNRTTSATLLPKELYDGFVADNRKEEAVILYSSGTTGRSKGIILSHFAIQTNADAIIDYMRPTERDCISIVKALSHSSALVGELLVALKARTKLLIAPTVTLPRITMSNISKFGVTILCVNPTLLKLYADEIAAKEYDLKPLKALFVSGSILNDPTYAFAHRVFGKIPIYNVYGLSEAGPRVTAQRANCNRSNSVGVPIKGVRVAIVDDEGNLLPVGRRGNIHIKTPSLFDGYVQGTIKHPSKYKGWFHSGDIGFWDEDGELHVTGRCDDVIILDAHKIYPQDVEAAICAASGVKECAVTAVEDQGRLTLCCVYVSDADLPTDIRKKLGVRLLRHEIPKRFVRTEELPKTPTGKVVLHEIQAMLKGR